MCKENVEVCECVFPKPNIVTILVTFSQLLIFNDRNLTKRLPCHYLAMHKDAKHYEYQQQQAKAEGLLK